jgi:DNA-binding transcriptional LysR family regulator
MIDGRFALHHRLQTRTGLVSEILMQIEALKIYCDVVRLHSFSRGAEANDVLQSSASQIVQNLEETLGVTLIDRSRRPWAVTAEGKVF